MEYENGLKNQATPSGEEIGSASQFAFKVQETETRVVSVFDILLDSIFESLRCGGGRERGGKG